MLAAMADRLSRNKLVTGRSKAAVYDEWGRDAAGMLPNPNYLQPVPRAVCGGAERSAVKQTGEIGVQQISHTPLPYFRSLRPKSARCCWEPA